MLAQHAHCHLHRDEVELEPRMGETRAHESIQIRWRPIEPFDKRAHLASQPLMRRHFVMHPFSINGPGYVRMGCAPRKAPTLIS